MGGTPDPDPPGVPCHTCQRCGAHLRPGWPGTLCEPSSACPPDIAGLPRETGFFTREPVRRALAGYDFGYLFRAVRPAGRAVARRPNRVEDGSDWSG
jgi:hypothetical protein